MPPPATRPARAHITTDLDNMDIALNAAFWRSRFRWTTWVMFESGTIVTNVGASGTPHDELANAALAELTGMSDIVRNTTQYFGDGVFTGWACSPYATDRVWVRVPIQVAASQRVAEFVAKEQVDADKSKLKIVFINST